MQGVETWIHPHVCHPPRSFIDRTGQPSECLIGVAERGLNDTEFVRQTTLSLPSDVRGREPRARPHADREERPARCRVRQASLGCPMNGHRLLESRDGFGAAARVARVPTRQTDGPSARRAPCARHAPIVRVPPRTPRHVMVPGDVRMHQWIQGVEFDDPATRRERLRKTRAAHSACECQW